MLATEAGGPMSGHMAECMLMLQIATELLAQPISGLFQANQSHHSFTVKQTI
jgi:hypothetical protein